LAENPNLQNRLRQAINAAQRGDKLNARRQLQQILTEDGNNEIAWMWMASVVDTADERRACLERALKINPNNARAREALRRMGIEVAGKETSGGDTGERLAEIAGTAGEMLRTGGNRTLYFALAAAVGLVLVGILLASLLNRGPNDADVRQTATVFALAQQDTVQAPLVTVTPRPTVFTGIVVTRSAAENDLPPTFTPTATDLPSATPPPTATPYPLAIFPLVFSASAADDAQAALFAINADGSGSRPLNESGAEVAFSPDGGRVAFIRLTGDTGGGAAVPQIFVASLSDLAAAQAITQMQGDAMSRPSWSPDGTQIAFSSNEDGDEELYVVSASGGTPAKLTDNEAIDRDPVFSPDGRRIVYSSDIDTPGSSELFAIPVGGGASERLTDASGSSTQAAFSPDGQRIVYVSDRTGDNDIYIMDANGQRPFLVTIDDGDAEDRSPSWSPDGRWIAFVSNRGGDGFQAYLISLAGDVLLPVTTDSDSVQSVVFQPVSLP
jgi:dipeptidyl aminopeptidase/acylaminoacyl peptidase